MSALCRIAQVDVDQVYWGLGQPVALDQVKAGDFVFGPTEIAAALPAGAIYVAEDCDQPGGRYRLVKGEHLQAVPVAARAAGEDGAEGGAAVMRVPVWRLEPLAAALIKDTPGAVSAERALYEQLKHLHQRDPAAVPPVALYWARQWELSIDADEGRNPQFAYFGGLEKKV